MIKPFVGKARAAGWFDSEDIEHSADIRTPHVLASTHDTTDDFFISADTASQSISLEMTFEEGERLATWMLEAIAERRSAAGQTEQQEHRRQSEVHAGHPIDWPDA